MSPTLPNEIYQKIKIKLNEIHTRLAKQEKEHLVAQIQFLNSIQKEIDSKLDSFNQNAEWDTFTIAFYGETNAGKSTLIEALRIYFKEKTKMDSWNEFKNIHEIFLKEKENLKQSMLEQEEDIERLSRHIAEQIEQEVQNRKSFWYRLISFFKSRTPAIQIKKFEKELDDKKSLYVKTQKNFEALLNNQDNDRLLNLSDGVIIGDGRSDFTRKTTSYAFNINNQNFQILDVAGIEGDESQVIDSIDSATKKAHCVFYITRSPTPPQKGDDGKEGTLEKIKKHLGAQSEVYAIFNKSITNPRQLEQALINEGERQSLQVLDEKMCEALGEHYIGRKNLCAKVAFLALAECLFDEKTKQEREKFLSKYDSETLLQKSGFSDFADFIARSLIKNTQAKIKKSHYKKASEILCEFQTLLTEVSRKFQDLLSDAQNEVDNTKNNLERIKIQNLKIISNKIDKYIEKFKINVRIDTYDFIDSDVSDKEFEETFKIIIRQEQKILENNLILDDEFKKLQEDIKEELENLKRRISYAIQDFNHNLKIDFEHNISMDMKSGIDTVGIFASLLGVVGIYFTLANFWNPVGWTAAALTGIATLIGFGKSIYKFFSSDYKKSEQKRAANENLKRISENIKENIEVELEKLRRNINEYIQNIQRECETVTEHMREPYIFICQTQKEIRQLTYQIQHEGELP
ncbi:MAG: hypothetical protein K2N12_00645 [Helicobacter sp.]|nr:hypothetical protein [Helicobacter sp.]